MTRAPGSNIGFNLMLTRTYYFSNVVEWSATSSAGVYDNNWWHCLIPCSFAGGGLFCYLPAGCLSCILCSRFGYGCLSVVKPSDRLTDCRGNGIPMCYFGCVPESIEL